MIYLILIGLYCDKWSVIWKKSGLIQIIIKKKLKSSILEFDLSFIILLPHLKLLPFFLSNEHLIMNTRRSRFFYFILCTVYIFFYFVKLQWITVGLWDKLDTGKTSHGNLQNLLNHPVVYLEAEEGAYLGRKKIHQ